MLTDAERMEIRLADKYENSGPLTKEDYFYQRCATEEIHKLQHREVTDDDYCREYLASRGLRKKGAMINA